MAARLSPESFVAIIMGPSGVGKDTLIGEMAGIGRPPHFHLNASWTTRPRRHGEAPDAYHFVDRAEFERAEAAGEFLQTNKNIYGNWYGTPYPTALPEDTVELFNVLAESAGRVQAYFPHARLYLIEPPSLPELRRRLESRGVFDFADLERREHAADAELRAAREIADHRLVSETGKQAEVGRRLHDLIRADWHAATGA
jgi:guanylate kinase